MSYDVIKTIGIVSHGAMTTTDRPSCQSSRLTQCDWLINKYAFLTQKISNNNNGYIFPVISTLKNGGVGKISQL